MSPNHRDMSFISRAANPDVDLITGIIETDIDFTSLHNQPPMSHRFEIGEFDVEYCPPCRKMLGLQEAMDIPHQCAWMELAER
jgi:hypothetical protein